MITHPRFSLEYHKILTADVERNPCFNYTQNHTIIHITLLGEARSKTSGGVWGAKLPTGLGQLGEFMAQATSTSATEPIRSHLPLSVYKKNKFLLMLAATDWS